MSEHVTVADAGPIRTVRMNRPDKKNALTASMYDAMAAALETANGHAESARIFAHASTIAILFADARHTLRLFDPFVFEGDADINDGRLTAMMPGRVVKVMAKLGDKVKKGQALIIMEAMKMEHTIVSPRDGVVERVAFKENDLVPADAVLFAFAE